jgi:hypothetical protein
MLKATFISKQPYSSLVGARWDWYLYPLWYFAPRLQSRGVTIKFVPLERALDVLADVVCLDNRCFHLHASDETLDLLRKLRTRTGRLLWFDSGDSTGRPQFRVLPFVDAYYKRQLLKDRTLYYREMYGGRLYTDFYHCKYGVTDEAHLVYDPLTADQEHKVGLSWNFALMDHRWHNKLTRLTYGLGRKMRLPAHRPDDERPLLLSARFGAGYSSATVAFQRARLLEVLAGLDHELPTNRISRREFQTELGQARAVLSPFGWGEVCHRDFETFIAGAALIKPDMSCVETWPDLYRDGETYLSLPWSIEEMGPRLTALLADTDRLRQVAWQGQTAYRKVWSEEGAHAFCQRFVRMLCP